MMLDGRQLAIVLMVLVALIQGAYGGIQVTASGGGNGESGSFAMNLDTLKSTALSSQITINGATITPFAAIAGPIAKFEQTHSVKDASGKGASVYVKVLNAPSGLAYTSKVLPKEGSVPTTTQISAEQWLTVPEADSITCTATSLSGTRSAHVSLVESKNPSVADDYVTLTGYYGKAVTAGTLTQAYQKATSGTANSIKIYGTAKDSSGTYKVYTPLKGISGGKATFTGLSETSSAGTTTQVALKEHVHGTFTSTATYTPTTGTAQTKTRTSNYGTEYDLNMKAVKGFLLPIGILGYYVKPGMTIQGAVNAAQTGDTINVAAWKYVENVNINKGLTLKGTGSPTATSFALNAKLGTGSGGITAPVVNVNPVARIQDGVTLASSGGTVNVAAGNYKENVKIDKSLAIKGAGSTKTIIDGNNAGSVFGIGMNNPNANVALSGMKIQGGSGTSTIDPSGKTYVVGGGILNRGKTTITGSIVSGNSANLGGGIANSGTLTVTGSTISGNSALNGGGINNYGTATISGSTISGNSAKQNGGGINSDGTAAKLTVSSGSTISLNTATHGGGIHNWQGTATVTGSKISGNTALNGGGIDNDGTATVSSSTISGNLATWGGGINNWQGTTTVTSSTISGNSAKQNGGGINNGGTMIIMKGSYIFLNIADSDANGYGMGGGIRKIGGSLVFKDEYGNPITDPNVINSIVYNNHLKSNTGPLSNIA